jgi:alcohol dehydrogenase class IV
MHFEFATATRIIFGEGTLREAGPAVAAMGSRALLVLGRTSVRAHRLIEDLKSRNVECVSFHVATEPTTDLVRAGTQRAKEERCDLVIGFGGGSVLDAGKAMAALLTNQGELSDYLEVIGLGKPLTQPSAPYITIPTTAGTGTEVTRNAVLASPQHRVKVSLRSPLLLPKLALVDPELTYELPAALTASTGMDALTQLIEPYVSVRANPLTDALCLDGMRRVSRSLRRSFENGQDTAARSDMAFASLLGGLALANAGLGAVHGFAAPLGGMFPAPHGAVCAALLPHVMRANVEALRERQPENRALQRYGEIARILTGSSQATADDGIAWVLSLCASLRIAPLKAYSVTIQDLPDLVAKSAQASSMRGNPIPLTSDEMTRILRQAL